MSGEIVGQTCAFNQTIALDYSIKQFLLFTYRPIIGLSGVMYTFVDLIDVFNDCAGLFYKASGYPGVSRLISHTGSSAQSITGITTSPAWCWNSGSGETQNNNQIGIIKIDLVVFDNSLFT